MRGLVPDAILNSLTAADVAALEAVAGVVGADGPMCLRARPAWATGRGDDLNDEPRLPLLHLDRIYVRGLRPVSAHVPHGRAWARMSDHLPLVAELSF